MSWYFSGAKLSTVKYWNDFKQYGPFGPFLVNKKKIYWNDVDNTNATSWPITYDIKRNISTFNVMNFQLSIFPAQTKTPTKTHASLYQYPLTIRT